MKGPATFSRLNFGQGGGRIFPFSKQFSIRRPPLAQNSDPPLERGSLPPKPPQMRGTPGSARSQLKMRFFSTEIDGSGWALVSCDFLVRASLFGFLPDQS